ncbi:MAG: hypothetical protein GC134_06310 [Proteobacteria bacterium]|nr:hypothetical protein [Pseudomonadota bacterium]
MRHILVGLSALLWAQAAQALPDWPIPAVPAVLKSEIEGIQLMREEKGPEAIAALEQAVKDGSNTALYRLAQIYYEGLGEQWAERDKSIRYLQDAINNNQVEAMFVYALVGDNPSDEDAIRYMDRAATLGMAANVFKIGLKSMTEKQPFSMAVGVKLVESAARAGFDPAMPVLGRLYIDGDEFQGIPADKEKAEIWLNRAVRAGYVGSISDLLKLRLDNPDVYPEEKYKWLYLCRALKCSYLTENPDIGQNILPMLVKLEQQMTPDMLAQTKVEINSLAKRIQRSNAQQ